ncbi:ATP-dependent (S)-NAD(P)H-hydrate dehydratase [Meloidogyne graminicola]|uniref:ATP-dependent (S)-NAD(P)H-hydrate dehydratase n=1 Tax=Meloidogyne graminicola TaxID=189291 RepID=A0A8T0A259_9BILA|nr:ATP-dependent (S)-NAD(P)H-hydrate dehydratase [Meloidogyne graminicola]
MSQISLKELLPVLSKKLRKGDCGKVGVIGGSAEYTGAPYFSAIASLKIGADLTFVYTHPSAAPTIKNYSPDLIVYPTTDLAKNRISLEKLDALVFGPGLGREQNTKELLRGIVEFARNTPNICVVIDADGLFYLNDCFKELSLNDCRNNLLITPNHREFERLYSKVFPEKQINEKNIIEHVKELAAFLGITIVRKGEKDIISNGTELIIEDSETSLRRCGGQGDILGGAIALFAFWVKRKRIINNKETNNSQYLANDLMTGALAAAKVQRKASLYAFARVGRSMLASDVIDSIPEVLKEIDLIIKGLEHNYIV